VVSALLFLFWFSSVDIKSAWAGNDSYVLLSRVGPYKLFYKDLRIGPGRELESEVHISLVLTDNFHLLC